MKYSFKIAILSFFVFLLTVGAFFAGTLVGNVFPLFGPTVVRAADQPAEFYVFWQVWELAQAHFIDRDALDNTRLTYGAVNGLISALGDEGHTRFLTPEEVARQRTDISGKFFG